MVQAANPSRPRQSTMASLEENYMGPWQPFEERNEPGFHEEMYRMQELDKLSNSNVVQGKKKSSTRSSGRRQDQRLIGNSRGSQLQQFADHRGRERAQYLEEEIRRLKATWRKRAPIDKPALDRPNCIWDRSNFNETPPYCFS